MAFQTYSGKFTMYTLGARGWCSDGSGTQKPKKTQPEEFLLTRTQKMIAKPNPTQSNFGYIWYITKELELVFSVFMKFLLDCHDEQKTIKKEKNNNDSLLQV